MRAMNFIETEIDRRNEAQGVLVLLGQVNDKCFLSSKS